MAPDPPSAIMSGFTIIGRTKFSTRYRIRSDPRNKISFTSARLGRIALNRSCVFSKGMQAEDGQHAVGGDGAGQANPLHAPAAGHGNQIQRGITAIPIRFASLMARPPLSNWRPVASTEFITSAGKPILRPVR